VNSLFVRPSSRALCFVARCGFDAITTVGEECAVNSAGCQWQTLAWSFQANPALSQATLVSGWLELIDPVISSEASCSWGCQWQTLAWSFQANPALSQATLVSGWLSMSVARASSCHDTRAEASTTAPMTDFMIEPLPPTKSIAAFDST